jgi:AbrB family looped-hinge helix DNA binding protein
MKRVRSEKPSKVRVKNSRKETLAKAFGTDRERIKSFTNEDRGEDRRFERSLQGFGYREENHEASRYLSKTVAMVTLSSKGRVTIPREMRARLGIEPGQMVSIRAVDGAVRIVPMRESRKSERGSLPSLKPFVRERKTDSLSKLKQMLETPPERYGEPLNPRPRKMKENRKTKQRPERRGPR